MPVTSELPSEMSSGFTVGNQPRHLEFQTVPERHIPSRRLIINGQGKGAAQLFDKVIQNGHEVAGVITTINGLKEGNPDPLRVKAMEAGLPIINLGDINQSNKRLTKERYEAANKALAEMKADLSVGFFLQATMSDETLAIPKDGSINLHLGEPGTQGKDTMSWDIRNGKDKVSAMAFLMNEVIDGGPVINTISHSNPGNMSQGALYNTYLGDYVQLVSDAIDIMAVATEENRKTGAPLPITPQDPDRLRYFPVIEEEHMEIIPDEMTGYEAYRIALSKSGAWIRGVNGEKVKLYGFTGHYPESTANPGDIELANETAVHIATAKGSMGFKQAEVGSSGRLPAKDLIDVIGKAPQR